ncbi:unnamed protein product [Macrosiphum euphorbiae]|nr:unnamed protein product [Macrosiphum euphorbiae]
MSGHLDENLILMCLSNVHLEKNCMPISLIFLNLSAYQIPMTLLNLTFLLLMKLLHCTKIYSDLRPYPGRGLTNTRRIFNYRLSRARRTVECAFGVLSNKWRVLHTPLLVEPDFADDIIKACCILHNFVRKRDGYNFEDMDTSYLVDGLSNRGPGVRSQGIEVRDSYAEYFMGPGSVPFQYNKI